MPQIKVPRERLRQLWILVYLGSAVLAFRLIDIQLLRYQYYRDAAERNRTQIIYQNAPRGRIITKDGVVLASNQPSFSLIYLPGRLKDPAYLDQLADDFSPRLGLPTETLLETIQSAFERGIPARLAENISTKSMFAFSELKTLYPGVDLVVETKRYYPYGQFASHLIGYMGKIDRKDWADFKKSDPGYRMDSPVGRSGIEKMFERYLHGKDGGLYLEVDSRGRLKRVLDSQPWSVGSDIHLTLDFETQKAAEEGLKGSITGKGAVVAINPQNGAILALASSPDFDPNFSVGSYDGAAKPENKVLPEYNLAVQGLFAPGSVFKIITAAAALESGRLSPDEKFYCPGYYNAGSRIFKCWEPKGHGRMDFINGMANSCDVYFYNVGLRVGPAAIEKFERGFGLGRLTGIPIPGEKAGHVFGPLERAERRSYWFIGDTLNLSIGQGELLVTPLQMAQLLAAVANRGFLWRPHYVEKITRPDKTVVFEKKVELLSRVNLKAETWDLLRQSLKAVVEGGTGTASQLKDVTVYGKTGTAQNSQGDENAWFAAFAERAGQKPEIAVAVLVQHGHHGGASAAPIAQKVIAAALRLNTKPQPPAPPQIGPAPLPAGRAAIP